MSAGLMSKSPGLLCCCASPPGELNRDLKPYLTDINSVLAAYQFYTLEWVREHGKAGAKTVPRETSFSRMDSAGRWTKDSGAGKTKR